VLIGLAVILAVPAAAQAKHHRRHPVQRCAGADTPATIAPAQQMRSAVVCLINLERTGRRLPALRASPLLDRSAQTWTDLMVLTGNFSHGPGNAFALRISAAGYNWQTAGENIAAGYPTPRSVVAAWMASAEHCRNVLDPVFRDVGTGINPRPVRLASSGPATWTQDFGLLQSQSPPSGNQRPMDGCPYR
jgi:uncharacterized protein YkwD